MVPVGGIGGGDGDVSVCECGEGDGIREFLCPPVYCPSGLHFWAWGLAKPAGHPVLSLASDPAPGA